MTKYSELIGLNSIQSDDKYSKHDLLKHCWEIRNFEIELFWKRATYFSILVGAIFAGIYSKYDNSKTIMHFIMIASGIIMSYAWYIVGRGSKHCMEIWENHIDFLEEVKIYKTILCKKDNMAFSLTSAYHFAVGKIMISISLFVLIAFLVVLGHDIYTLLINKFSFCCCVFLSIIVPLSVFIILCIVTKILLLTNMKNYDSGIVLGNYIQKGLTF